MANITDQPPIEVFYVPAKGGIAGAKQAFDVLEAKLLTIKQRKFYAAVFGSPPTAYWACVAKTPEDNPEKMGLQSWTIPGGKYAQGKLMDWSKHIEQFKEVFGQLRKSYHEDRTRPCIEYYRSFTEVLLRLPIESR